ncbi:uncharacterized protein LOC143497998 [Brachyhypopomus gauderio]|uniref:uncharacterized protein LOC143497998 n=1 Tax=Brachyhypopomus gauderio TaxID=698409 RepID=UPI004042D088
MDDQGRRRGVHVRGGRGAGQRGAGRGVGQRGAGRGVGQRGTMTEAGQRVQPNLSRFSVATIILAFREHNRVERLPFAGGRPSRFTPAQEVLIVDMVRENNMIRLREIQERIICDNVNFQNIDNVSLTTIDRVLKCQRVPFERNSDRCFILRHQYVQKEAGLFLQHKDPG